MVTTYISNNQLIRKSGEEPPTIDRVISGVCQVDNSNNLIEYDFCNCTEYN